MEKVGDTLANLRRGTSTHPPAMKETEPTREEQLEELRKSLGVSTLDNTFDSFLPEKGTEQALKQFRALAGGKTTWQLLFIYGGTGNGKSHLLEALVIELYKRGLFSRVVEFSKMMSFLRGTMDKGSDLKLVEIMANWCRAPRLIIDDVGIGGSDTEWSMKMLEEIVLARHKENLFTVLSTNMDISELPERVVSRFTDPEKARMVQNRGEDYRPKKA